MLESALLVKDPAIAKALIAKREGRDVEFEREFDTASPGSWCEVIKDIVAMANSGGGVIVLGLEDSGVVSEGVDLAVIWQLDGADVMNLIAKYISDVRFDVELIELQRSGSRLPALRITSALIPNIFEKPGTYSDGKGGQKSAFSQGTLYFRHGAKSEPGVNADISRSLERHLETVRRSWLNNVRKVITAPEGTTLSFAQEAGANQGRSIVLASTETGPAFRRARKEEVASTTLVHERISPSVFSEVNNIILTNGILARDSAKFVLGESVYFRVYSEAQDVASDDKVTNLLFEFGVQMYAPYLSWANRMPDESVARWISEFYLGPRGHQMNTFLRFSFLLGDSFVKWLKRRLQAKWGKYSQPPGFYHSYMEQPIAASQEGLILAAAKLGSSASFKVADNTMSASELARNRNQAWLALSETCEKIFLGNKELRGEARSLDYIVQGSQIAVRATAICQHIFDIVGDRLPWSDM